MKTDLPEGLGDVIEKILEKIKLAQITKKIFGENCGCKERKEKLNRMFPNDRKTNEK